MAHKQPPKMVLAVLLLAGLACSAMAGGYGRGKPHRIGLYSPAEYFYNHQPATNMLKDQDIPSEFNWCAHEGVNHCTASWNQHIPRYCGSCWAHGTLSMIQDRLKIAKLRAKDLAPDVMLGRQTLLNCAGFKGLGDGCNGGEPLEVFKYMTEYGLPDESCLHYAATDHHIFKKQGYKECPTKGRCINCMPTGEGPDDYKCWGIKKPIMYKLTAYGKLEGSEQAMQEEIMARGPIVCGIASPDDFVYHYHSSKNGGVFIDKTGDKELDHDIEIVGWGEENGTKYWLARNSWGTYWGELGFFKLERGTNALQVESGDCWYAVPEFGLENQVVDGDWEGSMYGLKDVKDPSEAEDDDDDYVSDDDDDDSIALVTNADASTQTPADMIGAAAATVIHVSSANEGAVDSPQAAQIVTVSFDDVSGEATVSSADVSSETADAESVMTVMGVPVNLPLLTRSNMMGSVKHACAGMRQSASSAVDQLWNALLSGAGGSWMQPSVQEQNVQQQQKWYRGGRAARMMGPGVEAPIAQQ